MSRASCVLDPARTPDLCTSCHGYTAKGEACFPEAGPVNEHPDCLSEPIPSRCDSGHEHMATYVIGGIAGRALGKWEVCLTPECGKLMIPIKSWDEFERQKAEGGSRVLMIPEWETVELPEVGQTQLEWPT